MSHILDRIENEVTEFADIVAKHDEHEHEATIKQRAYMVTLVFQRDIPDKLVDLVLELYARADLPKEKASEVISLLVAQPSLTGRDARARRETFSPHERQLKDAMSRVLDGAEWPSDIPLT